MVDELMKRRFVEVDYFLKLCMDVSGLILETYTRTNRISQIGGIRGRLKLTRDRFPVSRFRRHLSWSQ
jgi:hypothetical protein